MIGLCAFEGLGGGLRGTSCRECKYVWVHRVEVKGNVGVGDFRGKA